MGGSRIGVGGDGPNDQHNDGPIDQPINKCMPRRARRPPPVHALFDGLIDGPIVGLIVGPIVGFIVGPIVGPQRPKKPLRAQ